MMKQASKSILFLILALGSLLITISSLVYFNSQERAPFVIEKLPLTHENLYEWMLKIHVVATSLALPGCLLLSLQSVLKRWPRFHRYCGRVIGIIILFLAVPSGFYLAFFARGAWLGTAGFLLTGLITWVAMILAIQKARAKQYTAHRRFSMHVLGQLSVAVTSRVMLYASASFNYDHDTVYLISLWLPVLASFALVELIHFSKKPFSLFSRRTHEKTHLRFNSIPQRRAGLG